MAKTQRPAETEMKTYILHMQDGTRQKVTVPKEWKVTFGALFPGKDLNSGKSALRFWEGHKENQRAVFTGVESFRDDSIAMEVEVAKVSEHGARVKTPVGEKDVIIRGEVREWVNPDDPKSSQDYSVLRLTDKDVKRSEAAVDELGPKAGTIGTQRKR